MHHQWRGCPPGGVQHVHDRVVSAGAYVQDQRTGAPPPQRQFDRPGHIGNVGEVTALAAVAVDDDRLARLDPAAERFQGKIGPLPRSPNREEPQRHEAQTVQAGGRGGRPRPPLAAREGEMSLASRAPRCRTAHPGG